MKQICTKCLFEKSIEEFKFRNAQKGIRHKQCSDCQSKYRRQHYEANQEKYKQKARDWDRKNMHKALASKLNSDFGRRYDLTTDIYNDMLNRQNGNCAICLTPPSKRRLAVDHDHSTGAIRELLCTRCNMALGLLNDDPALCCNLAGYLIKHEGA